MIGPKGINDFYSRLQHVYGKWIVPQEYTLKITEIDDGEIVFSDFKLRGFPLVHSDHSVGFRIKTGEDKVVAYSGDSDYCQNLISLAREVDLLILECSFPDDQKVEGHLTPSLAGRVAQEAGCKRLLLTHLYPPCDNCDIVGVVGQYFHGEVILAEDLMKVAI